VVEAGQSSGIGVSICGEMAADLSLTQMLVGLGIREMSVQPRAIASVRDAIRRLDAAEAARLAERSLADASGTGGARDGALPS